MSPIVRKIAGSKVSLIKFCRDEEGASAVEYGLLASLLAAAIIVTLSQLGTKLKSVFQRVDSGMTVP